MSDKPFNVSDKRHFTAEGDARGEEPEDQAPVPAASKAGSLPKAESSGTEENASPRAPAAPAEFGPFLLSLGAQAGMLLSGTGGDAPPADALEGARAIISILEMLKDKTQGRRTVEEERILDGLLFELRMAYVERSRGKTA